MRTSNRILERWRLKTACSVSMIALSAFGYVVSAHSEKTPKDTSAAAQVETKSPIKHVIILIGENRGLDHTFGVYKPKGKGETISNLLSKGIVNEDGSPGPELRPVPAIRGRAAVDLVFRRCRTVRPRRLTTPPAI